MRRRAVALLAAALAAGCGGPKEAEPPTPEDRMPATTPEVARACAAAGARYREVPWCPARLPASRDPAVIGFGGRPRAEPCAWLLGLGLRGPAFEVVVGGQCRTLPVGLDGNRWPADDERLEELLDLVGATRPKVIREDLEVHGEPALLVGWPTYTLAGSIHAGHQALLWNEGGQGLVASAHFDEDVPAGLRLRLLRATAESMRPVR